MVINSVNIGTAIGLILISIGWILQIVYSWGGRREIRKRTLIFYSLGVAVLVINSIFIAEVIDSIAVLNFVSLVLVSILLMRISKNDITQNNQARVARRKKKK